MNPTGAKLLPAAAVFVGGERQLAVSLGIGQSSVGKLMADLDHAPDPLRLRAADLVLAHRQSLILLAAPGRPVLAGIPP